MFNDKSYETVNREERFYCALFSHALLTSAAVRERFGRLVLDRCDLRLDADSLHVFVEAAALRDYWYDLGSPLEYSNKTHDRRREILNELFSIVGLEPELIDQHDFFWTSSAGQPNSKLWSPGRWNIPRDGHADLSSESLKHLHRLKWAFNAKPDILLVSGRSVLMLEAKLESGEGVYDKSEGSRQTHIQKLIGTILGRLAPSFRHSTIKPCTLGLWGPLDSIAPNKRKSNFSWKEVANCCETPEVDPFTKSCLSSLERYRSEGPG